MLVQDKTETTGIGRHMGEGLKRAFKAAALTRIKPKRNAVIIDLTDDGLQWVVTIECKDSKREAHLRQMAKRALNILG